MKNMLVLSPTGILGYGYPESSLEAALRENPDMIGVDAGSTDPGPYYLGAGVSFTGREAVKRDASLLLRAAVSRGIPLVVGSAGGSGGKAHTDWTADIFRELAGELGLSFPMAVIYADVPKALVKERLISGGVTTLDGSPELSEKDIDDATGIVAQMGVEPLIRALEAGAQVVIAGRAYDPAVFAALPILRGYDPGLAVHMGKILECACIAAVPGSASDCLLGRIYEDRFEVWPASDKRVCTVSSVAAHTLYEKNDPVRLHGPGCLLDLSEMEVAECSPGRVAVRGSRLHRTSPYYVKLEGARAAGYRTVCIAATRDPVMIREMDGILEAVKATALSTPAGAPPSRLTIHVYGKNGVMGELEPVGETGSHELCLVIEALAESQEKADALCALTRSELLHFGYPGRLGTGGNLALPFSPSEMKCGRVYHFCVYALMRVDDPCECFTMELSEVRHEGKS